MNFDSENTFDLNEILDHLDDFGHKAPSDDADRAELFDDDEPSFYRPEAAVLYNGRPESGSIVRGARVLS